MYRQSRPALPLFFLCLLHLPAHCVIEQLGICAPCDACRGMTKYLCHRFHVNTGIKQHRRPRMPCPVRRDRLVHTRRLSKRPSDTGYTSRCSATATCPRTSSRQPIYRVSPNSQLFTRFQFRKLLTINEKRKPSSDFLFDLKAEDEGFKPPIPERGIPDFESSAFGHSANLPIASTKVIKRW